jgi:hypothetical protein
MVGVEEVWALDMGPILNDNIRCRSILALVVVIIAAMLAVL